jgi:parvulin-like peptidyl-prolyl isomerase
VRSARAPWVGLSPRVAGGLVNSRTRWIVLCGLAATTLAAFVVLRQQRQPPPPGEVVGKFAGGVLTDIELDEGMQRLAPALRREFDSPAGRREVAQSLIDKKLLAEQARKEGIDKLPAIRRQVEALEERLMVQELLRRHEAEVKPLSEQELQRAYDKRRAELVVPEKVHLGRVLAAAGSQAQEETKAKARKRAEEFRRRLMAGDPLAAVAPSGDGAERTSGGDIGWFSASEDRDATAFEAASGLKGPGAVSQVRAGPEGMAVYVLLERSPARIPTFAEARVELQAREESARKRRSFDEAIASLRQQAHVDLRAERR